MERDQIRQRVREVLCAALHVNSGALEDTINLKTDLDADSLDMVEVVMGLEHEFNIKIEDKEMDDYGDASVTVFQLIDLVASKNPY